MGKLSRACALTLFLSLSTLTGCGGDDDGGTDGGNEGGSGAGASGGAAATGGTRNGGGSSGTGGSSGGGGNSSSGGSSGSGGGPSWIPGTIGNCDVFPAQDPWNTDVSGAPVDAAWTERLHDRVGDIDLHPDYGSDGDFLYGIPINVVPANQPPADVTFEWWPEETDEGPYPFPSPPDVKIEGNQPGECDGDCHLLVVQQGSCQLYEGYACQYDQGWTCGNGAVWDLNEVSYGQRPEGWTSADAAGLPVAPGLVRYEEVRSAEIRHAIRFTLDCTTDHYVAPATHFAVPGDCDPTNAPPMGMRVRLKQDFDVSVYSESARVVLTAMKKYGLILADNGSNFFFQGEAHAGWTEDDIEPLKQVPASAFEVLEMPPFGP